MPFVQRNWKGKIAGLYSTPQPQPDGTSLTENDPLPDDHPEVLAYLAALPSQPDIKPPSFEEIRDRLREAEKLSAEGEMLRKAAAQFNQCFSELEISLSALLYASLGVTKSHVAYAIYYSPTSFDARAEIVANVIIQLASECAELSDLLVLWKPIAKKIDKTRRLRNAVAHGTATTVNVKQKNYVRISAPAFDIIRLGRKMANDDIPGVSKQEVEHGIARIVALVGCIDAVNRLVTEYHEGNRSLHERYRILRHCLTKLGSASGSDLSPSER